MKGFKFLTFLLVGLIFLSISSSGSPGEKMTCKPGIELSQGNEIVLVNCYVANAPVNDYVINGFNPADATSPLFKLTDFYIGHYAGETYRCVSAYRLRNYNDSYRYLDARKSLCRYARRHRI